MAASTLANNVELLENILQQLPERKLVTMVYVNHFFKSTIEGSRKLQERLYSGISASVTASLQPNRTVFPQEICRPFFFHQNQLLDGFLQGATKVGGGFWRHCNISYQHVPGQDFGISFRLFLPHKIFRFPADYNHNPVDIMTCADMFVTAPPTTQVCLGFVTCPIGGGMGIWRYVEIHRNNGVKVRDLVNLWWRYLSMIEVLGKECIVRDHCLLDVREEPFSETLKDMRTMDEPDSLAELGFLGWKQWMESGGILNV